MYKKYICRKHKYKFRSTKEQRKILLLKIRCTITWVASLNYSLSVIDFRFLIFCFFLISKNVLLIWLYNTVIYLSLTTCWKYAGRHINRISHSSIFYIINRISHSSIFYIIKNKKMIWFIDIDRFAVKNFSHRVVHNKCNAILNSRNLKTKFFLIMEFILSWQLLIEH